MLFVLLAFLAGVIGPFFGGTGTFILTGACGLLIPLLKLCGVDTSFIQTYFADLILVPCIIFNGACASTAYLAKKRNDIKGYETGRPLGFAKDPMAHLIGGIFSVIGYLLFSLFNYLKAPLDTGALVVIIVAIIIRIIWGDCKFTNTETLRKMHANELINVIGVQLVLAIVCSLITIPLVKYTGIVGFGFSISALTLIFCYKHPTFPATHQITMVAGYAYMQTGSIAITVIMAVLSQLIFAIFALYCNTDCNTHIDPPAVGIMVMSLIIFTLF